jgi:hypothetical protein
MTVTHGPACWALHHECAVKQIVDLAQEAADLREFKEQTDKDVGIVGRTKAFTQHWHTDCPHLGCRVLRLRQHYDEVKRGGGDGSV